MKNERMATWTSNTPVAWKQVKKKVKWSKMIYLNSAGIKSRDCTAKSCPETYMTLEVKWSLLEIC